ncbi:MAG: CoA transferase [Phreatobacter sp.]|uniref:CaiB/BaiF CoA transferase family protein n=1 Tax=Phreatobacter sp. TaxID=1966341 RepID=UPI001A4F677F|nr:CaiB/BaiF CoA-transferase family protein [Phreatobacter sp.]MBL8568838.1 CoA transferase [Phreatobacter sp.]
MSSQTDLSGLLVVSVEQAVAAPYAASRLADAGARVIKIEREEGDFARRYDNAVDGESAYFVWLNRGKESVVLDLKEAGDQALLAAMVAKADVFIQNLAPGALKRIGFDPEELRRKHPRLITCSISGYGEEGPWQHLKAYDLLVQAESGLSEITGEGDSRARVGVSVCDIAAGMTAYQAILQALIGRSITGEGRHIAVSLFHALADWMNVPYLQYAYGGIYPQRSGLNHPTIAPYGAYPCADGKAVLFSIQNEREWASLCENVLGDSAIAADPRFDANVKRVANRAALDTIILGVFAREPREAIIEKLEKARVAYGRVSSLDDLKAHPQNRYMEVDTPAGRKRLLTPGALHDGAIPQFGPVPALGEHTAAVKREFELA